MRLLSECYLSAILAIFPELSELSLLSVPFAVCRCLIAIAAPSAIPAIDAILRELSGNELSGVAIRAILGGAIWKSLTDSSWIAQIAQIAPPDSPQIAPPPHIAPR